MADKKDNGHWMEAAFGNSRNQLRKSTRTKSGEKIPARKLAAATHSRSPLTRKRAVLAETARKVNARRSRSR